MARGDTFNKNKKHDIPVFEKMLDSADDKSETLSIPDSSIEEIKNVFGNDSVPELKPRTVEPLQPKIKARAKETVTRTLRMDKAVSDALGSTVSDGKGGKISGSKGFMGDVINNALIKELVFMGALDKKYLENVKPYE